MVAAAAIASGVTWCGTWAAQAHHWYPRECCGDGDCAVATELVYLAGEAVNKALAWPTVREALTKIAAEPAGGSPAEFGALIKSQVAHRGKVVKDAGIKVRE